MRECSQCKVIILDHSNVCPLCRAVIRYDDEAPDAEFQNAYPDVTGSNKKLLFVENLVFFLSIVLESVLVTLTFIDVMEAFWPILVGLVLVYVNVVLRMSILGQSGYMFKFLSGLVFSIILLEGIDILTGDRGWSLELAWPCGVLALDIAIITLMIINRRNWQSYMMVEILAILLSIVPVVFLKIGKITFPYLILGAMGASLFLFLGTLILGDHRARTELKRRFHI